MYISAPVDSNVFQMTIVSTIFHRNFNPDDILQRKYDCAVLYLSYVGGIAIENSVTTTVPQVWQTAQYFNSSEQ